MDPCCGTGPVPRYTSSGAGPQSFHNDPNGSMQKTEADTLMPPEMQQQFDKGLCNYMVKNQYTWEKVSFIRKVYGILIMMCFISYLISIPFMTHQESTVKFLYEEHHWILWVAAVVLSLQFAFYLVVLGLLFTGQNLMLLVYIKLLVAFPTNFIWATLYVVSFTIVIDTALATYDYAFIAHTFLYTMFSVLGLLLYTYAVKVADFKQLYAYNVPVVVALLIWFFQRAFGDLSTYEHRHEHTIAALLSIVFGWIVAYDTQLIFGTKIERGRKYPYQMSMYTMAAYEMYFDVFVNFYLGGLNLFPAGSTDDPLTNEPGY